MMNSTAVVRQRRFAAELIAGKPQRQAAIAAGVPPGGADAYARRTLQNPHFRSEFHEMLDRAGLSEEAIARIHAENLQATKMVVATQDGKITDVLEQPDYATRQRAVRDAWQLRGRVSESGRSPEQTYGSVILKVDAATYARLEKIRGAPFPPGLVGIESEEAVDQRASAPAGSTPDGAADVRPSPKPESESD